MISILSRLPYRTLYMIFAGLLAASFLISVGTGAVYLSPVEIFDLFRHKLMASGITVNPIHEGLFFQIRLPRTILCMLVGSALSVSGVLMQSLFRNPIVEPGLMGTSAGAAMGAALLIVLGNHAWFNQWVFLGNLLLPVCAFLGALAATLLVYYFSISLNRVQIAVMILAGIAVNAMANGVTGFLAYIARDPQARSITFWNLGSLSGASWPAVSMAATSTIAGIFISLRYSKALNALQLGEAEAGYLGVNTDRLKISVILLNTLLVAVVTSLVGVIGFIGLVVPHILRMIRGSDNRYLITGSGLVGSSILLLTDSVCRIVIAPAEMPIGIVTAFIGGPVFLWMLSKLAKSNKRNFYA